MPRRRPPLRQPAARSLDALPAAGLVALGLAAPDRGAPLGAALADGARFACDLAAVLARMAAEAGPRLSPAVRLDVVVHAVDGLEPGAYRYRAGRRALLHRRRLAIVGPARAAAPPPSTRT